MRVRSRRTSSLPNASRRTCTRANARPIISGAPHSSRRLTGSKRKTACCGRSSSSGIQPPKLNSPTRFRKPIPMQKWRSSRRKTIWIGLYEPDLPRPQLHKRGTDIKLSQILLCHNDLKTTLRYIHLANQTLENIVSPFDQSSLKKNENLRFIQKTVRLCSTIRGRKYKKYDRYSTTYYCNSVK